MGAGGETDFFVREFYREFNIVAYGAHQINIHAAANAIRFCRDHGIPFLSGLDELKGYQPDYIFMASYPTLITADLLNAYAFINMHGALVPSYRGFHGGTWAMINGDKYHGYTIHQVDTGIDSGPVYYQGIVEADLRDDINTIRAKLLEHFQQHAAEVFGRIFSGTLQPVPQDDSLAKYVCRRTHEDGLIDWQQTAWNVFNLVRALTPPYTAGAFTFYRGEKLYITKAIWSESPAYIATVGQVVAKLPDQGVLVKCRDRALLVQRLNYRGVNMDPNDLFKTVGARFASCK